MEKRNRIGRAGGWLLLVALTLLGVGRSAWGTRLDSFTADEPWHVVAGVAHLRHGDFALNPEQPPLIKLWTAAWMPGDFRVPPAPVLREKGSEREWVENTMYRDNDDLRAQAHARLAMWSFHALLLIALGAAMWRAFGLTWAVGTLAFLALEPTVGAHLPVVMTDLPAAMTLGLVAVTLGILLATWRWKWAFASGLALGLALASKHSALPGLAGLAAFALLAWTWHSHREGWRGAWRDVAKLAFVAVLGVSVLWATYGFRFHPHADGSDGFNRPMAAKVDDLRIPLWRDTIRVADDARLLPRAYLWGLADTVRAGIEGRGFGMHFLWGRIIEGKPPWYTWPSLIVVKLPLALLAMALLGVLALWRAPLTSTARWSLGAVAAMGLAHAATLYGAHTAYAGLRHALPLVMVAAVLAGAWVWRLWGMLSSAPRPSAPHLSLPLRAAAIAPLFVALVMTAREPRLWEYHNELVRNTPNAYRYFANESLDLGQRFHELNAFYRREILRTGKPVYYDYWLIRAQAKAAHIPLTRRAESLQDENREGIYDGWFVMPARMRIPCPQCGWDPKVGLRGLEPVARFGEVEVWRGRQVLPLARADSLYGRIIEHIYQQNGNDWPLVARRAQEIVELLPQHVGAGVELGNAQLRMGHREAARKAYQRLLDQKVLPVDELTRVGLQRQIARLDAGEATEKIQPLRHSWME